MAQNKNSKDKFYLLHGPDTHCISKGMEHKKYEFGNKASFAKTTTGVVVGAKGFRNGFDGHTLEPLLKQVVRLMGKQPEQAAVDRSYNGSDKQGLTKVLIPWPRSLTRTYTAPTNCARSQRKGIHPSHYRPHQSRSQARKGLLQGHRGDNINKILAASAFNFKKKMNKWKKALLRLFERVLSLAFGYTFSYLTLFNSRERSAWTFLDLTKGPRHVLQRSGQRHLHPADRGGEEYKWGEVGEGVGGKNALDRRGPRAALGAR